VTESSEIHRCVFSRCPWTRLEQVWDRKRARACSAKLVVGFHEKTDADPLFPIYYVFTGAFRRCIQTPQPERSPE
jgi:hypothetical protein